MKAWKRKIALLTVIFIFAFSFAGCRGTTTSNKPGSDIGGDAVMKENTMPITEEPITLTVWTRNHSQGYAKSYNDMKVFKKLAEVTGVHLDFIHPTGAVAEQLNIILASNNYPDIISYYWGSYSALRQRQIKSGVAVVLNEYLEKYAPNFNAMLNSDEVYKQQLSLLGDKIGYIPSLSENPRSHAYDGYFVRQDWLNKVGLGVPTNMEEWEAVLTAFRDKDPNGNGIQDEVPFMGLINGNGAISEAFMGAYGLAGATYYKPSLGKVTHQILDSDFKEFLGTMSKWYAEKLLGQNYLSANLTEFNSLMINNQLGALYIDNNNDIPKYMMADPNLDIVPAPFPAYVKDPSKIYHQSSSTITRVGHGGVMITKSCQYVKEAVRYFDYLFSKEGSDFISWGIEGESYTVKPDGTYQFTDEILKNPEGKSSREAFTQYIAATGFTGNGQWEANDALEVSLTPRMREVKKLSEDYSLATDKSLLVRFWPNTIEELEEISRISNDLNTYIFEQTQKFFLGQESMENYDAFVEQAKKMGVERIVELMQAAYDRGFKK